MKTQNKNRFLDIIFSLCLLAYSLMLINQGITLTDTGYNYGNFVHFDSLDVMWKFSIYLATAVGAFFTHLPLGKTMLGLNLYTGLVKASIALIAYFACVYGFQMKRPLVFLAELMALGYCWCPTALLYNYCTYLLFTLGGILLCLAVKYEKNFLYVLAGICLGANVLVRFPNAVECLLIVALWISAFQKKKKFMVVFKETLLCIGGYLLGLLIILIPICLKYGLTDYIAGIKQVLAISESSSGYSVKEMIKGDFFQYRTHAKWIGIATIPILLGTALYFFTGKRFLIAKRIFLVVCSLGIIYFFYKMKLFQFVYYNYTGIESVGILFLLIAIILGLRFAFISHMDANLKMFAMVMGEIILITPLGSNNYLLTAVNNLFLVTPFIFHCIDLLFSELKKEEKPMHLSIEPLRIVLCVMVTFIFFQGVLFGARFVFRDGINGEKRTAMITDNPILSHIKTNEENGRLVNEINSFLNSNHLKGSDVILYGDVPALSFYMELKPVLSSTWPDLASFSETKYETELSEIHNGIKEKGAKPLVITGHELNNEIPKCRILNEFLEENDYELVFHYDRVRIYR